MTRSLANNEDEASLAILMLTFHANDLNDVFPLALLDYPSFLIEKVAKDLGLLKKEPQL